MADSRSLGSRFQRRLSRKHTLNLNESAANSLKAVGKETGILFRDLRSVRAV
jgi:hypothetical protein